MNAYQQRKLKTYQAELGFMDDNAQDFPADSTGGKTVAAQRETLDKIAAFSGAQQSDEARRHTSVKGDKLDELIELLQMMNRASNAMADQVDGIEDLFRMPRRRSTAIWLAKARTFYTDSATYEKEFKNYDLPDTFRADLMNLVKDIETASEAAGTANSQRAGATGGLADLFKTAGRYSNKLDAVVRNKYRANAQKLAAWAVASHVASAAKSKDATQTPRQPSN